MHFCDKGLVLREVPYRDADMMLTVLTETNGKISASARGVRRKSSRISAAVQQLAYSEFTFFESGGRYTVNEAEPVELFFEVRQDITKLALCSYFAELLDAAADSERINPELLRMGLNTLYALSRLNIDLRIIKAAFELRLAAYSGYAPVLGDSCVKCGKLPERIYLAVENGAVCCRECGGGLELDPGAYAAVGHILGCDLKRLFSFTLGEGSLEKLAAAAEAYLTAHFERNFKTLSFYKSLSVI